MLERSFILAHQKLDKSLKNGNRHIADNSACQSFMCGNTTWIRKAKHMAHRLISAMQIGSGCFKLTSHCQIIIHIPFNLNLILGPIAFFGITFLHSFSIMDSVYSSIVEWIGVFYTCSNYMYQTIATNSFSLS